MPTTQLSVETRDDGSGVVVPSQTLTIGQAITIYAIGRDDDGEFVENLAADSWGLTDTEGNIVSGDLVPEGDDKSAVFTAALDGNAIINIVSGSLSADSGLIYVIGNALVTLEQVRQYLGFLNEDTTQNTDNDPTLVNWITMISGEVEDRTNQAIVSRPAEDIIDGDGSDIIYTITGRVSSLIGEDEAARLANLQYRTGALESWVDLVDDERLILLSDSWAIRLLDGDVFPVGTANIRIEYNAGFSSVPSILQKLALEFMQIMWDESKQGGNLLGRTSKNISEAGVSMNVGLKSLWERWTPIIDRYRRLGYT